MPKTIFALVGMIASGKGAAVEYLKEKYSAGSFRFSDCLTSTLNRLHLEVKRENLQKLSQVLRENFGEDLLAKVASEDAEKDNHNLLIIDGARRPEDIKYLKKLPNFVLIEISADAETRYQRLLGRTEKTDDQKKTLTEFLADQKKESEQKISAVTAEAQERINNNGDLANLQKQLDELVIKYVGKN